MADLTLADAIDVPALSAAFDTFGRIQIGEFLTPDSAQSLLRDLSCSEAWKLTFNRGDTVVDYSKEAYAVLDNAARAAIAHEIVDGGRRGFQFCYDTIRHTDTMPADAPLARFVAFMNSAPVLDLIRNIVGIDTIAQIDGHASRYGAGQFLTTHDDAIAGKGRRAAYVMNLSPRWHPDWGGLLQFYDTRGNITRGFTPAYNTLNLFAVPQAHSVSWVTPLAHHPRLAITGWMLDPTRG